uniref:Connector enhancer of kinase suppressor of Ras 1 n=1 Tax=Dromaius novaehollandiae TaxID=8790 RepID=A0A8C4JPS0_DRONO
MEPVGAWSPAQAAAWLRGLDAAVQGYPFEAWGLPGAEVLRLSAGALEALGVRRLGHQELLLEAVEQLRALVSELASTSLRTLTEELRALACRAQELAPGERCPGAAPQPPSLDLLACVVELVGAAKALFCWLNRYLFSTLNDYSASRDIVFLCAELVETLQEDCPAAERSGRILPICQHIVGICESIVGCSPAALLDRTAVLQRVALPAGDLEITSTSSGLHFIAGTASEVSWGLLRSCPAPPRATMSPATPSGDAVGGSQSPKRAPDPGQVGWTPANLAKKLLEEPSGATLVLKKIPLSVPGSPGAAGQPVSRPSTPSTAPAPDWEVLGGGRGCSEPACSDAVDPSGAGSSERPGSPASLRVATRLSRRRVSCRDLGRVDCDGWLLKKKDHVGFMAQKWKRCWFVLKGHTLYWYSHPSDEKAAGLINVATYDLESTREQKKKYVFQLSHEKYKPFIFAAETLADLSMWVSHLITAKSKFTLANQSLPHREEDCYSETEAEDPDDDSPRRLHNSSGEDLESLMQCLKQGGVSLIGRQRFLTEEQCRKSFVKRNKNPLINEKVHLVRALQSTLKAKLTELQVLEQLLSDAALTSEKFTSWKEEHQDLYQELREWWVRRQGQDLDAGLAPTGAMNHLPPLPSWASFHPPRPALLSRGVSQP